jgi:hypothetical protein
MTFGNKFGVTTGRCSNPDQNVRWLRAVFGGGLIDGASRDSMSPGRFVLCVADESMGGELKVSNAELGTVV